MPKYNGTSNTASRLSLRDPAGQLIEVDGRLIRLIASSAVSDLKAAFDSKRVQQFVQNGKIVPAIFLGDREREKILENHELNIRFDPVKIGLVVEHPKVPFRSFAHEWPAEMLYDAAFLTLDLAEGLLNEGLGLKDATPHNILFEGHRSVFIDVLSFEKREPGDSTWFPYAQFVRTFLNPLMAHKYFGIPLDMVFLTHRDGIESAELYALCGPIRRLLPPFLISVSLPEWLSKQKPRQAESRIYQRRLINDHEKANFILGALFRRLRRTLVKVSPFKRAKSSPWSTYMSFDYPYSEEQLAQKQSFFEAFLKEYQPKTLLDVGCNNGYFSAIAAKSGARVVAIDSDPRVVGMTWKRAKEEDLDILPLVVNLTRPSPAVGWLNNECPSFLDRAVGAFDAVIMFAVIHHMLISERIPIAEILELVAQVTNDFAIIEFVGPKDLSFRHLSRGRDYTHISQTAFEDELQHRFNILSTEAIVNSDRILYLLKRVA